MLCPQKCIQCGCTQNIDKRKSKNENPRNSAEENSEAEESCNKSNFSSLKEVLGTEGGKKKKRIKIQTECAKMINKTRID